SLLEWKSRKVIQDSAWDRLAQFEVPLHRISPEAGRQIVRARLERFLEPFAEADAVRQRTAEDALFPLGTAWADEFFRDRIDVRPRDVVNAAREAWRREQEDLGSLGGAAWL